MNNKGFAITGILYTIFVLFLAILLSVLSTISYKKGVLEKTIVGLEDSFGLEEVTNISDTYKEVDGEYIALLDAKYMFKTMISSNLDKTCVIYMKKGEVIPTAINGEDVNPNFTLIPNDCNKYSYTIKFSGDISSEQLTLFKVFEFKESD